MTLETDIEALRERVSDTQELYREVCVLLFFRYGETPTANKLYQLVRKGSMSAPAKALREFWVGVREKTRVDVGQPDLPPEVATAAGELASRLWQLASETAQLGLQSFQQEAQEEVDNARRTIEEADREREMALDAAREAADAAAAEKQQTADTEAHLVREHAANTMLREELERARNEAVAAGCALADARRDFAGELEKLRISLAQNEQRLVAAEKRALMEIENERAAANRARKELQRATDRISQLESAHRVERDALRDGLAGLKARRDGLEQERVGLDAQLSAKDAALAELKSEADSLRHQVAVAAERAASARTGPVARRPAPLPSLSGAHKRRRELKLSGDTFRKRVRVLD
ncbi:plasmid replication DNA-binding protein KfrA [Paraburkholderia sp. BL6669N2]|uniref:DNA-binding protein n=1 Tax=Paraburkholderia sp. BL6669N2 TaxID=1938807 RepID=UPI000E26DCF0|nr:DNA-binding protein [Paraburkholderia sp. BL6669N2]REG49535.1 plasmid replication DNA-binding protein KfrA [Paraburkholderia sp. BL6669N2]